MSTDNAAKIFTPVGIEFSEAAACKAWELIFEEENLELKLRAFVTGGGCSGLQYGFTFDEKQADDDTVIERVIDHEGSSVKVLLVVDPMSYQYLVGAEIDYVEDVQGSRFVIRNPNAITTCGCGSSFSVE